MSDTATVFDPVRNLWCDKPGIPLLGTNPLVSIIVPSFNQGRYIRDTIESIISQDYRNLDVIVVDGASKDETLEVLRSYAHEPRLRYISEPDDGVADAVNKGLVMCRGEVCAIQSSDDCYLPHAITTAVAELQMPDCPGLVYGDTIRTDAAGAELHRLHGRPHTLAGWLSKQSYIPQPAAFFRMDVARRLDGWNARYFNADTEYWLRMLWLAPVRKFDAFISLRRMHGEQRDTQGEKIIDSHRRLIDESEAIRSLSWSLRRAASSGKLMHRLRYGRHSRAMARLILWRAVLVYPELLRTLEARHRLLPFGAETLALASACKRAITSNGRAE
ncbi:MAG: glycosyltransferase [Thermomonas sp.]|uniref:glycosyltransferase family 2 protein n=1 Tax=Thermomonas sp. TaxID=1971895 RepID=UPI001DF40B23|nr:glycosyltransferase family 2 protein [Thermomonas sp.]MBZ0087651.1 glycosyltransferase [Thermomonas sp.]